MSLCVCGSGLETNDCCAALHDGKPAPTALSLMRARYSAYVLGNMDYLERTCTEEILADFNPIDAKRYSEEAKWLGLKVLRVVDGEVEDQTGQVEFKIEYKHKGHKLIQHELASFIRVNGEWLYSSYKINPKAPTLVNAEKVGRNDPCPCGSNKKYKKCCGA